MYYGHLALWISNKVILRFQTETTSVETVSKQHTNIFFTLFIAAFTNSQPFRSQKQFSNIAMGSLSNPVSTDHDH